ncbi:MAG: hypothetical protein ACRDZ9_03795 [Acidimicrobiales bacterium]
MFGKPVSLGFVFWMIMGVLVVGREGLLANLNTLSGILSALLGILAWPLMVLNVRVAI